LAALDIDGKLDLDEAGDARWPGHLDPQVVSIRTERFIESVVVLCNDSILGRLRWICAENMSQPLLKFDRIDRRSGTGESCVRRAAQGNFELCDQVARFGWNVGIHFLNLDLLQSFLDAVDPVGSVRELCGSARRLSAAGNYCKEYQNK